jgi:hypothetical protein
MVELSKIDNCFWIKSGYSCISTIMTACSKNCLSCNISHQVSWKQIFLNCLLRLYSVQWDCRSWCPSPCILCFTNGKNCIPYFQQRCVYHTGRSWLPESLNDLMSWFVMFFLPLPTLPWHQQSFGAPPFHEKVRAFDIHVTRPAVLNKPKPYYTAYQAP